MRETVDFDVMMKGLMIESVNKEPEIVVARPKNEPVYKVNGFGFQDIKIRSFFKRRGVGKC